jgi:hypothetical protein
MIELTATEYDDVTNDEHWKVDGQRRIGPREVPSLEERGRQMEGVLLLPSLLGPAVGQGQQLL